MGKLLDKLHDNRFLNWTQNSKISLPTIIIISYLLIFIVMAYGAIPVQTNWDVGMVATKDIIANRSLTYEDEAATKKKQIEAKKHVPPVYKVDVQGFNSFTLVDIDGQFTDLTKIIVGKENAGKTAEQKEALIQKEFDLPKNTDWKQVLAYSEKDIDLLHSQAVYFASQVMSNGISETHLDEAKTKILQMVAESPTLNATDKIVISAILKSVSYYPTSVYDAQGTADKEDLAIKSVEPVQHTLKKGQTVIKKGDILTQEQYEAMKALGLTSDLPIEVYGLGIGILLALIFALMWFYTKIHVKTEEEFRKVFIIFLVTSVMQTLLMPLILAIHIGTNQELVSQVGYLFPMAMGVMIVASLLTSRDSLFMLFIYISYFLIYTAEPRFILVAIVGGLIGTSQTKRLSKRADLGWAALSISVVNAICALGIGLLKGQALKIIAAGVFYGLMNGFISVVLTIGILPYLEMAFKITTPMTLIELANPTSPLLKRMMQEAPGTYHHSLMVANLAENIADRIGANGLLVRVAAYYHDIGKLKRPLFFAENQLNDANPHDKISPMLSTLIITSHVKDGIAMAKEAKLPENVIDLIAQHHGNTMVGYFYMKAKDTDKTVDRQDFRYLQKKPQTREAAILMIADTVEAAVRSRKGGNLGQLSGFIRQLIRAKLEDGQFEECDLTFRDLDTIAEVCTKMMVGIYHQRVEYPQKEQLNGK